MTWLLDFCLLLFLACQLIAASWLTNRYSWREALRLLAWAVPVCALLTVILA